MFLTLLIKLFPSLKCKTSQQNDMLNANNSSMNGTCNT